MASSSSSLKWLFDVFLSFRGEDIRKNFLSHLFKELDLKLINVFRDYEIEKSQSLWHVLEKAIWSSRIAVVVFSKNYASSSWCLIELLEIVNCKDKIIIPIFYGLDPSHVRKQTGEFGKIFEKICEKNTEEVKNQWKEVLTDVASLVGYDSANWANEAKMIEEIAKDVLDKLLPTSSKDFENFVGMEDHMAKMSELLQLESEEVRMVGIWGSSGIGKTTIARALFNQLSRNFQVSKFIDRAFVSKCKEPYSRANPDDHNMKLHLQENFLSEILRMDIKIDHLGALGERLHHQRVLVIIDDLDDPMVLKVLADKTQWFGSGSRIIVVTNDRHFLMAHRIDHIYLVSIMKLDLFWNIGFEIVWWVCHSVLPWILVIPMVIVDIMVLSIRRALGIFGVHYEPPALEQLPPDFDDDDEVVYRAGQVRPARPQVLEALPMMKAAFCVWFVKTQLKMEKALLPFHASTAFIQVAFVNGFEFEGFVHCASMLCSGRTCHLISSTLQLPQDTSRDSLNSTFMSWILGA